MIKKTFVAFAIIAFFSSMLGISSAELIEKDWLSSGDKAIIYDTVTGLDWLGLDQTAGISYNDLSGEFGVGGNYEGFRHATPEELLVFFQNANIPDINQWSIANKTPVELLKDLWWPGFPLNFYMLTAESSGNYHMAGILSIDGDQGLANNGTVAFNDDTSQSYIGHALVRVGEPTPITYNLTGEITTAYDKDTLLPGIEVGTPFNVEFSYDPTVTSYATGPSAALYSSPDFTIRITVGGYEFIGTQATAHVSNDISNAQGNIDTFRLGVHSAEPYSVYSFPVETTPPPPNELELFYVQFVDDTMSVFSDTSLPPSLDLNDFSSLNLYIGGGNPTQINIAGIINLDTPPVDTDGDGIPDNTDLCPYVSNPDQFDSDSDGYGDACDNCPAISNPLQEDLDADGIGNLCDIDDDNDTWDDEFDNCQTLYNPDQFDSDGDGTGDACDSCTFDPVKTEPGQCGCGIPDTDTDSDGIADCIDTCPYDTDFAQTDTDGDGVGDACDNCPATSNATQTDGDRDGLGDACDARTAPRPNNPSPLDQSASLENRILELEGVVASQQQQINILINALGEAGLGQLTTNVNELQSRVEARNAIDGLVPFLSVQETDIFIEGANFHLRNGAGTTDTINGTGNLIIGYNALRDSENDRSGSHNLVIGDSHAYSQYGGLLAGEENTLLAPYASITGGTGNTVRSNHSVILGGYQNFNDGTLSSIVGGGRNFIGGILSSGDEVGGASILGGFENEIYGNAASVVGGYKNEAGGDFAAILGGEENNANGDTSAILGGLRNIAAGDNSSVIGGKDEEIGQGQEIGPIISPYQEVMEIVDNNTLLISGVNVQIVNGNGNSQSTNGKGNLILGYNEQNPFSFPVEMPGGRTGSHNIIVGDGHNYDASGGIAVGLFNYLGSSGVAFGFRNQITAVPEDGINGIASVLGGAENAASGMLSTILGGNENIASGETSAVVGGFENDATGRSTVAVGGYSNRAEETNAVTVGGSQNRAQGRGAVSLGGQENVAIGENSLVAGGQSNTAEGESASVGGGMGNRANRTTSSIPTGQYITE